MPNIKIIEAELNKDEGHDEDYYDANGNYSAGGLYDVGGHPIPERWADYADHLMECEKDRRLFGE